MKRRYTIVGLLVLAAYCLDRFTKYLAIHFLNEPIVVIPKLLQFENYQNDSFLFYLNLPYQISTAIISAVVFMMVYLAVKEYQAGHHSEVMLFMLILVGAFSNLLDRISQGHVIDFINVPFWSVFNLSDIYIVGGVLAMFIVIWKSDPSAGKKINIESKNS